MAPSLYLAAGAAALAAAVAGWVGYQAGSSGEFQAGRLDGIAAATAECEADKRLISATSHNEAARLLRENEKANHDRQTREAALATANRIEFASNEIRRLRDTDALHERVRLAEAAAGHRLSDGAGRVPRAAAPAAGSDSGGAPAARVFPQGSGADIVRLATRAEQVNAELALCRASTPKPGNPS